MKPKEFYALCEDRLGFLRDKYGFQTVSRKADDSSYIILMESGTTGVEVSFEFENLYPRLYLYRIARPTQSKRECLDLKAILERRGPGLIYPTQKTDDFLARMVQNVIAGKKNEAQEYPEDLDPDVVLTHYATALQQTAEDVLAGDHHVFTELSTFTQQVPVA